jgi:hypothetical protein
MTSKMQESGDPLARLRGQDPKTTLLVGLEQMVDARYPLPDPLGPDGHPCSTPTKTR